jgi:hypothetical protein
MYFTLDAHPILNQNIKRHRKLFEQLEEFLTNQQDHRRSINTQYSNVVNTEIMDSVITKNIIECETSDLIDRMRYKSGEITTCNAKDLVMSSVLDVSVFSQFKSLSKALAKEESNEIQKKKELSPIKKHDVKAGAKVNTIANKLNSLKSVENIINSIKLKYNKLKTVDKNKDNHKLNFDKLDDKLNLKKGVAGIVNYQSEALRTLKDNSNLCTTTEDEASIADSVKRKNSNKISTNRLLTLRKDSNKENSGSVLGSSGIQAQQDQKQVYNINLNLNLNLNVKDDKPTTEKLMDNKPKVINNIEKSKNVAITATNPQTTIKKKQTKQASLSNIKSLYYQQYSTETNRYDSIESTNRSRSRSHSFDKYGKNTNRDDISRINSNSQRRPLVSDIPLKTEVSQSPAKKPLQGTSAYNCYYTKNKVVKINNTNMNSCKSSLYDTTNNSAIRKSKVNARPLSINLNTLNTVQPRCETSKEKTKNKVFK